LYDSNQYVVTDENINSTIIDGSSENKSTITIATEEDLCIEPIILGFTIQDGSGTLMDRFYDDPDGGTFTIQQYMGGGILSYLANPILHYNKIQNNGGIEDVIKSGSAIYPASSSDDIDFIDRNTQRNSHCENDIFDFTHNFFENNFSSLGRHIGNRYFEGDIDLSNCVFDYWNCEGNGDYQTPIWVNIDDLDNLVAEDEQNSGCLLTGDVYVDPVNGNDDLNEGQSWESPFYTITNTLPKVIGTENAPINIYLAEGTYSPSTNGETFSITMISNVNLIGQGEEVTVLDAEQTGKVIIMEDCDNNTISDLTITGGLAEGEYPNYYGGGMYLDDSDPTLTHMTISENTAYNGGGMSLSSSNPTLTNVTIANNTAEYYGGGMSLYNSDPTLTHMTISENTAYFGGGMYLDFSWAILTNVTISGNTAHGHGGGMHLWISNPILTHVTISGNTAGSNGGGMYLEGSQVFINFTFTHVTIAHNTANRGGGMFIMMDVNKYVRLTNSIIWDNSPESIDIIVGTLNITYSDIQQGGWLAEGEGNIDSDPLFTNPENGDYTLQEDSPCIDAGTTDTDGDGYEDITDYCGEAPDMGAYEYITEDCIEEECGAELADVNGDSQINILDLVQISYYILELSTPTYECAADYNGDGEVNILDLVQIVTYILEN